jgi:DNA-binding NtrC family response regulator
MLSSRRKVLKMLRDQKLTVEDAEALLDLVEPDPTRQPSIPRVEYVGDSEWARGFRERLAALTRERGAVLIEGEEGTGKMQATQVIHYWSRRASGPLINLECTSSAETTDAELFGVDGSSGGVAKRGAIDMAHRGTLALGNPEMLSRDSQQRLLRFLRTGQFLRVGGGDPVHADVRVVAICHHRLSDQVEAGSFDPDLHAAFEEGLARTEPLRDHPEDVVAMARYFLDNLAQREGRRLQLSAATEDVLFAPHSWHENMRELWGVLRHASSACTGDEITLCPG